MLDVDEAVDLILQHAPPALPCRLKLPDVLGLVLAEQVTSDIDSPAWDKSVVDGFAAHCRFAGARQVVDRRRSDGRHSSRTLAAGQATRIMTGGPIPRGCDAVVRVERTRLGSATAGELGSVVIEGEPLREGQNILRRGCAMRRGDEVLEPGVELRPAEIGLLAEVGRSEVLVHPRPRVAVLSTGNELVSLDEVPTGGQIRNSNGPMLAALVRQLGATPQELGTARDELDSLREGMTEGLKADCLVLSGGVSAGVLDLVPRVLSELGVRQVFHKVRVKPGKPVWFGVLGEGVTAKLVFGLPGNPVSSYVCFELFVRPALERRMGLVETGLMSRQARLTHAHFSRGNRPTYHPARLWMEDPGWQVEAVSWQGSADLRALSRANALVLLPAEDRRFEVGEVLSVLTPRRCVWR